MTEYKLINPHIEGKFEKLYSGETPFDAAKGLWENLSSNFTNCVPEFAFTVERVKDHKMIHFKVNEKVKSGEVDYTITELNAKISAAKQKKFNQKLGQFKKKVQAGGKKPKKDDSSDSDLYDLFLMTDHLMYESPITYFWYYPDFYPFEYDYYFVPTWIPSLSPYVLLSF